MKHLTTIVRGTYALALSLSVIALTTTGCGIVGGKSADAQVADISTSGGGNGQTQGGSPLSAFESGFYAFATATNSCVQCHGSSQAPLFAVSDPGTACANLVPYITMNNLSASTVVAYSGNGHCGIPSVCGSSSGTVQSALQGWATAVASAGGATSVYCSGASSGGGGGGGGGGTTNNCPAGWDPPSSAVVYTTAPMAIPSPLPSGSAATGTIINFNLAQGTPAPAFTGYLQIQAQYSNTTTYQFILPRMTISAATRSRTSTF